MARRGLQIGLRPPPPLRQHALGRRPVERHVRAPRHRLAQGAGGLRGLCSRKNAPSKIWSMAVFFAPHSPRWRPPPPGAHRCMLPALWAAPPHATVGWASTISSIFSTRAPACANPSPRLSPPLDMHCMCAPTLRPHVLTPDAVCNSTSKERRSPRLNNKSQVSRFCFASRVSHKPFASRTSATASPTSSHTKWAGSPSSFSLPSPFHTPDRTSTDRQGPPAALAPRTSEAGLSPIA